MEGVTRLRLPTHPTTPPPPPPHHPHHTPHSPTPHTLIHAIPDITVAVKKVSQNPAVLAS